MPTCWIIAGPNGAGKTTFALDYLPRVAQEIHFINADLIAAGLSPLAPASRALTASRIFLRELETYVARSQDFAFETTLAGRGYLKLIHRLKKSGWRVNLIYLALPDVEMCRRRVAERVKHGGHDIPEVDIERRYHRGLFNLLNEFSEVVDHCDCFMNERRVPERVFAQHGGKRLVVNDAHYRTLMEKAELL